MKRQDRVLLASGQFLTSVACRRLPLEARERYQPEWCAEVYSIIEDEDLRGWLHRASRVASFSVDSHRAVAGLNGTPLWRAIGAYSLVFVVLVSVIASPLSLYGGWKYLTSGGDHLNITKAKNYVVYAGTFSLPVFGLSLIWFESTAVFTAAFVFAAFNIGISSVAYGYDRRMRRLNHRRSAQKLRGE